MGYTPVSNWYHNFRHYGAPGESECYLPGLCMNPKLAGNSVVGIGEAPSSPNGLGYNLTIGTPVGDQTFNVPIEQMVNDVANMAFNAAKPALETEFTKLLNQGQDAVVNQLWPKLQPKIRAEGNYYLTQIESEVRRDLVLSVAAIGLTIIVGFGLLAHRQKKSGSLSSTLKSK